MSIITAGGVTLPNPVSISVDNEIIWSEDTGRTLSGLMVGDVIAEKKKLSIKWGVMPESDVNTIKKNLPPGFFSITFMDSGGNSTITVYRNTISEEPIGDLGDGHYWYKSVSVDLIQR